MLKTNVDLGPRQRKFFLPSGGIRSRSITAARVLPHVDVTVLSHAIGGIMLDAFLLDDVEKNLLREYVILALVLVVIVNVGLECAVHLCDLTTREPGNPVRQRFLQNGRFRKLSIYYSNRTRTLKDKRIYYLN